MTGPLQGLKVIEMAGVGPGPFCAMMFADMGAEVVRIDQKRPPGSKTLPLLNTRFDVNARGRRSLALDLKQPRGKAVALQLVAQADALIEGFRPGVMERLGLGPEVCLARNPRLVYGRITGWGQDGPLAQAAGHDINYTALSGALYAMGRSGEPPSPPLNLVADFGGGAMMLAFGLVCAVLEAGKSGRGQVIDAAMSDGATLLMGMIYGLKALGAWSNRRGENPLDGSAPYYTTYACADGKFISVGAIEPQFYALLLKLCGAEDSDMSQPMAASRDWPRLKEKFAALFKTRTRAQWCELLEGNDACFAPVLDLDEAPRHPHNQARGTFIELAGVLQPAPVPRFSRTRPEVSRPPPEAGEHSAEVLTDWGLTGEEIESLRSARII